MYAALLQHCEHLAVASKNADIKGRGKYVAGLMSQFKFALYSHFMLDLLSYISCLSTQLQADSVILPTATAALQSCILQVEKLETVPGPSLKCFLTTVKQQLENSEKVIFQGVELKGVLDSLDSDDLSSLPLSTYNAITRDVSATVDAFKNRFAVLLGTDDVRAGDAMAVQCFAIFNHDAWPNDLSCFGDDEIQKLLTWFYSRLHRNGCNIEEVPNQWTLFKSMVRNSFQDKSYMDLLQMMMAKSPYKESLKDLLHLVHILLVIPFTSSSCERMFSCQKRIKSDSRSSLHVSTVEDLVRISSCGPSLADFEPTPVVLKWLKSSQRRPNYTSWPSAPCDSFVSPCDLECFDSTCCGSDNQM